MLNINYSINGNSSVDDVNYQKFKENELQNGKIEEVILKTENKQDSIIQYAKIGLLPTTPDGFAP